MKNEIYLPREDSYFLTQILEKKISELLNKNLNLNFLEIGSGSGIHLETALKLGIKKQNIFSCDINSSSVKHCKNLGFNCVHSNLFENIKDLRLPLEAVKEVAFPRREGRLRDPLRGRFDVIIFNPPYLPDDLHEPGGSKLATTGGKKGSEIINEFLKQSRHYLNKNGKIFLLTSSHSGKINFLDYKKKILAKRKLFFEELIVWELMIL